MVPRFWLNAVATRDLCEWHFIQLAVVEFAVHAEHAPEERAVTDDRDVCLREFVELCEELFDARVHVCGALAKRQYLFVGLWDGRSAVRVCWSLVRWKPPILVERVEIHVQVHEACSEICRHHEVKLRVTTCDAENEMGYAYCTFRLSTDVTCGVEHFATGRLHYTANKTTAQENGETHVSLGKTNRGVHFAQQQKTPMAPHLLLALGAERRVDDHGVAHPDPREVPDAPLAPLVERRLAVADAVERLRRRFRRHLVSQMVCASISGIRKPPMVSGYNQIQIKYSTVSESTSEPSGRPHGQRESVSITVRDQVSLTIVHWLHSNHNSRAGGLLFRLFGCWRTQGDGGQTDRSTGKLATATANDARGGDAAENDKTPRRELLLATTTTRSKSNTRRRIAEATGSMPRIKLFKSGGAKALLLYVGYILSLSSAFIGTAAAADAFPEKIGYNCESSKCVFNSGDYAVSKYADGLSCMKGCGQSEIQGIEASLTDIPTMTINSSLKGTCTNCSLVVTTKWNFPEMLDTYDLTQDSLDSDSCTFTATMEINAPQLWVLEGTSSNCYIGDSLVTCRRDGNKTLVDLNSTILGALSESETEYVFSVDHVSTRLGPGTKTDLTALNVKFDGTGCRATTNSASTPRQVFNLELTSNSYTLLGMFSDTKMEASNPELMGNTSVSMSFNSGAVLRAGAFILLRVAKGLEPDFSTLITDVNAARMQHKGKVVPLDIYVGKSNISFIIPDSFVGDINNGDKLNITFDNFKNPSNDSMTIEKGYLSAFQGLAAAVDNSPIMFYSVTKASRERVASRLDFATIVIFGFCFLFSLVIIRWHGLPLTMTTLWTDMVAISALFSFAAGCGGFLVWVIEPSKAYVHWYTAQYFFNTMMILSLCFHWASVLSFKSFKKLSIKSPAVIGYIIANAAVVALIVALSIAADDDLRCVFDEKSLQCSSEEECTGSLAAEGRVVRDAVRLCDIQSFYLILGTGFVVRTLMLMVLGCMVMSRGRSLMLNEDPSEPRIRSSLTIFYIIIATTCVLYISAQVIYIAQYVSGRGDSGELSDLVWYFFIVWCPQGLPPLLLLFLQWNPSTETFHHEEPESIDQSSKEDVFNITPRSSGSSPHMPYSKLLRDRISMGESMINGDEPGNKLRLIVRLKLPANFDRACFVSLDFFSSKEPINGNTSLATICRKAQWKCVGTTEPVGVVGETESALSNGASNSIFPFVAVLEVPVVGHASNTVLRFLVHASTIGKRDTGHNFASNYLEGQTSSYGNGGSGSRNETPSTQLSYQMTMFHPLLEFVTSSQAVLDAAASGQPLNVHPTDEHTCTVLEEHPSLQREVDVMLQGNMNNAELSVQTVMMPGEMPSKEEISSHKNIGNIIRFFQYDTEDGGGGLVVEDLQESVYANAIPRQLIELLAVERQEQVEKAREDLHAFLGQKKDKQTRGFYGTLIGQIQDEGDTAIAREWLEGRLKKRKEYVALIRKNIQYLVNRDKHKQYFKASVEKKSDDLRFVPINLHIQDLLIGPTNSFINDEKRRTSKEVSVYDFTTVGAPSAHCYKFNKGGILSFQSKLKKLQAKISETDLEISKWPEEIREYDDLQWDLQLRMDCAFAQALAALTCSFVRKVEVAIQNPDIVKGEDMLCQLSTLGFLFQVESLLSTHGKEIGMLEDMAGSVANLSCVAFVIQDVRDKPSNRFSFRMSRKKDTSDEAGIVKVTVSHKNGRDAKRSSVKYIVTVQVATAEVELPDRLASGGEITVTPLLFTQGINEMQTIANNTERAKTELQDMININNLRPLKAFCEKYCRLTVALPSNTGSLLRGSHRYRNMNQAPMKMTEDQVTQEFRALETGILDAAQSLVKTKRPEILKRSSDLCRELGGGRVTVCKSAKDRTAMSVTLEQVRILHRHHDLPDNRIPATVSVMRSHGVRIENALKNTGKRQFAFNKLQRSLLPEDYRCPDQVGGTGNVS